MVFGIKKKKDEVREEQDPSVLVEFTKDIKIHPEESWGQWGLRLAKNVGAAGANMQSVRISGPSRGVLAGAIGGVPGILANAAMNPSMRNTGKVGGNTQFEKAPEIIANAFLLTKTSVKGMLNDTIVLEGIYDRVSITEKVKGADRHNKELLRTHVPQPDKGSFYSLALMNRIYNIEDELVPEGFVSRIDMLTGISAEDSRFGGKKFKISIATVECPIEMTDLKTEKRASMKSVFLKSYGIGKDKDSGAEYSFTLRNEIDKISKVRNFDVSIGDKDDKKKNIDIQEIMERFANDVQPKIRDVFDYAFVKTGKEKELLLSESFLKDFYA